MVKTNFYLNGTLVNPPFNHKEMEIELNFDKDRETTRGQVTIPNWDFVLENGEFINKWIDDGTTLGPGIFEGIPLRIEIDRNGTIEKPFNGYLDLTDNGSFSNTHNNVTAKEKQKIDWLNDVADGFTFEYLFKQTGEISENDFVFIPYVVNSIPDYQSAAIAYLSALFVAEQIRAAITKLTELAAELANPFEATAIIRTVIYVTYLITLILSLIKLIKDIITLLIQPVKYHAGMKVVDLLQKGANHLGLTFKSEIFETDPYQDLVIIPEKYQNLPNNLDKRILGFTKEDKTKQEGYYKGTFGQLLRDMKIMFNAKIILTDNQELFLVRNDKTIDSPQYQLPDEYNPVFTTNADELKSNYIINYRVDLTDKNTIQDYEGTGYQVILKPARVINNDLVLMKGLHEVNVPFALAKRKENLTTPEEIIKDFLSVLSPLVNGVVNALNGTISVYNLVINKINSLINALGTIGINISFQIASIPGLPTYNLSQIINNRVGMMKIETDFTTQPKIVVLDIANKPKNTKLKSNHKDLLHARTLYNSFHYVNSFYPTADIPTGNQRLIKNYPVVGFTFDDYQKVKASNIIKDATGNMCEIVSLKWNTYNQKANLTVRFPKLLTNNLVLTELIPDGK